MSARPVLRALGQNANIDQDADSGGSAQQEALPAIAYDSGAGGDVPGRAVSGEGVTVGGVSVGGYGGGRSGGVSSAEQPLENEAERKHRSGRCAPSATRATGDHRRGPAGEAEVDWSAILTRLACNTAATSLALNDRGRAASLVWRWHCSSAPPERLAAHSHGIGSTRLRQSCETVEPPQAAAAHYSAAGERARMPPALQRDMVIHSSSSHS